MNAPLAGIRVVEVASYVAVPAAGALLADMGAEVVKVEVPQGEIYRHGRPSFSGYATDFPESPPFQMDNKGKLSVALDLKRPQAREALARLIGDVDIFITNLLPARRKKYGLDHVDLLERFPNLLVGAISGYGNGGEAGDWPAFDYTTYWARTGMMDIMRDSGAPPSMQRPAVGDHAAAVNLVCGLLAALRLRDAGGGGQYVDVSLLQTGLHILGTDISNALVTREPARRHDRRVAPNALWNSYPVKEDRWLLLAMIEADRYWPQFCAAIERPDLLDDPRFADAWQRSENSAALIVEIEAAFGERTLEEWTPRLESAGLIWAPVKRVEEAIDDPQARAMGYFQPLEHATAGGFETVAPPFRIDGCELGTRRAASPLGADTRAIFEQAGLSDDEITELT
jgi:crotonobetainyl-CoA:carnitine CoA-transferase CaiB-like acyl-CoA transferase